MGTEWREVRGNGWVGTRGVVLSKALSTASDAARPAAAPPSFVSFFFFPACRSRGVLMVRARPAPHINQYVAYVHIHSFYHSFRFGLARPCEDEASS